MGVVKPAVTLTGFLQLNLLVVTDRVSAVELAGCH